MENAFKTLGATPEDDREKLKRLCEAGEAASGDATPFRAAYSDLVDPGKRTAHEIAYVEDGVFGPYLDILDGRDGSAVLDRLAGATVSVGRWFAGLKEGAGSLMGRINASRETSGFPALDDAALSGGAEELRRMCGDSLTSYLDGVNETSVARLFNAIVDVPDFRCPFVDDLMAYYDVRMRDALCGREARVDRALDALLARCDVESVRYAMDRPGFTLSPDVDEVSDALKWWYEAARPLEMSLFGRGGEFLLKIGDDTVRTENAAKNQSASMVDYVVGSGAFGGMNSTRTEADKVLAAERAITGALETFMERMTETFSELGTVADRLRSDLDSMRSYRGRSSYHGIVPGAPQRSGGCYIATCVYGSYDCPEVWTLRRYRDYRMSSNPFGRAFIKIYYRISPTLVKWFGDRKWFRGMFRSVLDRTVRRLQRKGYADTPYEDLM